MSGSEVDRIVRSLEVGFARQEENLKSMKELLEEQGEEQEKQEGRIRRIEKWMYLAMGTASASGLGSLLQFLPGSGGTPAG